MEQNNNIDKLNEAKEQSEVIEEFSKIQMYKSDLFYGRGNYDEIQSFINKTVDKYRGKWEVQNFYIPNNSNNIPMNQYDTLWCIEKMLFQYSCIKCGEAFNKK